MIKNLMNDKVATRIIFLVAGLTTAVWAVIIPFAKMHTGINDAVLGTLLLCLGMGAIAAMPFSGHLSSRYGCKKPIILSTIVMIIAILLLSFISNTILLAIILFIFGISIGMVDCVMNIQAILVEKKENKPLMSGFHGMYSVGGIIGAGFMTVFLALGMNIVVATLTMLCLIIFLFLISFQHLLPYANPAEGPPFAIPKGVVLILGMICFAVFLVEGTVLDWSAIYIVDVKKIDSHLGGLGFAAFATSMTFGRLTGDYLISKIGALRIVLYGTIIALIGFYCVITGNMLYSLLVGYFLIGAGCANIVPVMFNQIGKQTTMPQMVAVPAVTTLGYIGILAGPAMIGFIAHQSSLPHAFIFVAILMVLVFILTICLQKSATMKHE